MYQLITYIYHIQSMLLLLISMYLFTNKGNMFNYSNTYIYYFELKLNLFMLVILVLQIK